MRRFLIGCAGGFVLGYAYVRAVEAAGELRRPAEIAPCDAAPYGRLRRALMLAGIARSFCTLGVLAYGAGPAIEGEGDEPRVRRVALVTAALSLASIVDLPADFVEDYALERRMGLTKQTAGAWLLDRAKSFGITLAVGVPLVEALASAIDVAPERWPLIATAATIPLLILANVVVPTFVSPLFNAFEPLDEAREAPIRALAARYGAGDAAILRVDMSRQTEKANAYVTGLLGTKRIVIGDTLLERFEPDETRFVVAHELGHYVARDVWRMVGVGSLAAFFVFFGARAIARLGGARLASAAGLARLFFSISVTSIALGPALAAFSRDRERAADRFAIEATSDARSGAGAFRRLRDQNRAEDEQPRWMELLFSTHPSLRSRIARLEEVSARSPS